MNIIEASSFKFLNQAAIASVKACDPFVFSQPPASPVSVNVTLDYRLTNY